MPIYKRFQNGGVPEYLARHYWWAYLWRRSIWFFDHQPVINAILFGHYDKLLNKTLAHVECNAGAKLLQLTCVYGKLTPSLLRHTDNEVHLCDVATGQLALARGKTKDVADRCLLTRMNAESLGYANDAFDQVIIFFLLHELPPEARRHVYAEIARVVKHGGSVLITEYASAPQRHWFYRFVPMRWFLCKLEPFLPGFWEEDVVARLGDALEREGKTLAGEAQIVHCFANFYRVMKFQVGR